MKASNLSLFTRILILIAFYVVGGVVGNAYTFMAGTVALVWPPFGIALAALLLFGYRFWPGVALGAAIFSIINEQFFGLGMLGTILGNTVGAVVCAYLLERFAQFDPRFERVRDVAGFVGLACLLGTTVNALFISVALSMEGGAEWPDLFDTVLAWWIPNAMAGLVVAPLILTWKNPRQEVWPWERILEGSICLAGLAAGTWVSFRSWYAYGIDSYPLAYLPYPFLVWGALRFGPGGAALGTFLVSGLAIHALLEGRGPFVMSTERESLILIGSYISVLAVTNLLLAAVAAERRRAEDYLRKSEKRYRSVVEDQTDLIWRFLPDGTITFVNEAFCRFHGKSREEIIGSKYLPMLSDEDREIPLLFFESLPRENPVIGYDQKLGLPDGRILWQQCTTRRLMDNDGNTIEFQSVAQDVTTRKQSEEEARQAEQRLRAILNSMVDGVLVADGQGNVSSFNPAAERIFARHSRDVIGRPAKELFLDGDQRTFEQYIQRHVRNGRSKPLQMDVMKKGGELVPIEVAGSEVYLGGHPLLIVVVRDISERKRIEEQFRQSQKMEAVGRLAGGIAHDFNNLIQAIIGYSNLLLTRLGPEEAPRETVEQIEKSAERAAALTGQLLAFSRRQVLKPQVICLNSIVSDMTKLLHRLIGADIELVTEMEESLGYVMADPGQLEQVLLNLAINARDAMDGRGTLTIATRNLTVEERMDGFSSEFQPGEYVCLSIRDSGCGMPPEVKSHLFEPFFTTKGPGKGTGLGLSIVFGIVKQSSGEISVWSEPGKGSCFQIFLPRREAPPKALLQETPTAIQGGAETILLVEDGEIVRAMLVEVLQSQGYRVLEAMNGEEALDIASKHHRPIHLLITDLVMPKLGGRELADRLLLLRSNLRVLYMSGYSDDEVTRYGAIGTHAAFLQKPFRPELLLSKVRQVLDEIDRAPVQN